MRAAVPECRFNQDLNRVAYPSKTKDLGWGTQPFCIVQAVWPLRNDTGSAVVVLPALKSQEAVHSTAQMQLEDVIGGLSGLISAPTIGRLVRTWPSWRTGC